MDKEIKQKLLNNLLTGQQSKPVLEKVEFPHGNPMQEESNEEKLFEYRKQLKKIHAYEKIVKEDSENWNDSTWKKFEEWINPTTVDGMLGKVMEKKLEAIENDSKKKLREEVLKRVDLSLIEKLMK